MFFLAIILTFLPRLIDAQCTRELVLPWGKYSANFDTTTQVSCSVPITKFETSLTRIIRSYVPFSMFALPDRQLGN